MTNTPRKVSLGVVAVVLIVYLVVVQGLGLLLTADLDAEYGAFPDIETLLRATTLPVIASIVFLVAAISVLGWWRPVLHDDVPVQRWVWIVPAIMLATVVGVPAPAA